MIYFVKLAGRLDGKRPKRAALMIDAPTEADVQAYCETQLRAILAAPPRFVGGELTAFVDIVVKPTIH